MEYMPGGTLQTMLEKKGKLSVREAVAAGLSLCRALKAAHGRGIVHRDIKPGNILLGDEDVTKLGDFGIAHLPEEYGGLGATRLDRPHPCTPAYASPEQVRGARLDGRSDLYTVGVVLHEMVTGAFYFDRAVCHEVEDCLQAVLQAEPIPPRRLNRDVPSRFEEVVMRLLSKDPSGRHKDATELIRDLETVMSSPAKSRGSVRPHITSVSTTAQREEDSVRYRIRLEAENRGDEPGLWSGLTINLPCIASQDQLGACELSVSCSRKGAPVLRAPGDTLNGIRSDGSFGEMVATCLLVETPATPWRPRERVFLEVSFLAPTTDVEAHVRAWATWHTDQAQESNGDPHWSHEGLRDQQGIPAHRVLVSLQAQ
jgi:serine/threonine protein kinase